MITAEIDDDFSAWRLAAREHLQRGTPPDLIRWQLATDTQRDLLESVSDSHVKAPDREGFFHFDAADGSRQTNRLNVPRAFLELAESVACHSDSERWHVLYSVLYRLTHGEPSLLDVVTDPDVNRLTVMNKTVRRDIHKMHAFVRFRAVENETDPHTSNASDGSSRGPVYIAWFEPAHNIVKRATPFFARRFASMRWSILTPRECAHWNGTALEFTPGAERSASPSDDELEELWRSYYAHTFNPARVSTATMQAEMPKRYWVNLPEAGLISRLTRDAPARVVRMLQQLDAQPAEIPSELRSRVGDAREPSRLAVTQPSTVMSSMDEAGAWDVVHDPGVSAARMRSVSAVGGDTSSALSRLSLDRVDVRIGTASWTDPTLLHPGVFYPDDANTPEARLRYYASKFSIVEVDSTYYVPPVRSIAAGWAARSPDGFIFDVKAFALMTGHAAEMKRMPEWLRRLLPRSIAGNSRVYAKELPTRVVDEVWQRFQDALSPLRDAGKLGPILLQFPHWFAPTRENADALRVARERLGTSCAAVEFRNPAWVEGKITARTQALLEELELTYVVVDAPPGTSSSMPPVAMVTTPELSVIRLHGRRVDAWEARHTVVSERYRYLYDSQQLSEWTERIGGIADLLGRSRTNFPDMAKAKQGVHVVFNNCHANYGTSNATEITGLLIEFDKVRRKRPSPNPTQ